MHSIRRADYEQPGNDAAGDAVPSRRPSLYNCLHADDFFVSQASKRRRGPGLSAVPTLRHAIFHPASQMQASPSLGETRPQAAVSGHKLMGVNVDLCDLPGAPSSSQSDAREVAADVIRNCLRATWEPSTVARYNSVLEGAVAEAESVLGVDLLPCDTDIKLMLLFARFDGAPWGTISASKCAIRAWHLERGMSDVFQSVWSERSLLFWKGLKKRADHTKSHAKRMVYHKELLCFQRARLDAGTVAGIRDAAIAAVCFYGIRRSAEALALQIGDMSVAGDSFKLIIRRQKNDPDGRGMTCWLPRIPSLDDLCPFQLLTTWLICRQQYWPQHEVGHFFCVSSAKEIKAVSYDSWRKALQTHLAGEDRSVGTHSLRKGGASWLKFHMMMPDAAVQAQGGWATPEVMHKFYVSFPEEARHAALEQAFERFSLQNSR